MLTGHPGETLCHETVKSIRNIKNILSTSLTFSRATFELPAADISRKRRNAFLGRAISTGLF